MTRLRLLFSLLVLLVVSPASPARAGGDDALNFNESNGCGSGVAGVRPPEVGGSGFLPTTQVVHGPWADFYGRNRAQIEGSMVDWTVPMSGGKTARVHVRALPALRQVAAALQQAEQAGAYYGVDNVFGWAWRTVSGRSYLSQHFFATAIDFNPPFNPLRRDNTLITNLPAWFVAPFRAAGFCWGGDWVNAKDPMHFSWMGPAATPGYGPRPAPYPPLTGRAPFDRMVVDAPALFGGPADPHPGHGPLAVADRSRDGSGDLYRVRPAAGHLVVEAAGSRFGYGIVGFRRATAVTADRGDVMLADLDGDGHRDLVVFDRAAATFVAYTDASDFDSALGPWPLPDGGTAEYHFGYFDGDYAIDLFSVRRGPATALSVWSGAAGFATALATATPALGDTADTDRIELTTTDYDVDGRADLVAVTAGSPAAISVVTAASGLGAVESFSTGAGVAPSDVVAMDDYDGDGRDDLYVMGPGRLRVYLGGLRPPAESLTTWFLPEDPPPWDAGPECVGPHTCDQIGYMDSRAEWSMRDEVASDMEDVEFLFGNPGDVPFVGDWDCDGVDTPGLYRQSDGFVYLRNANSQGVADAQFFFGNPGDVPLAGDFNGDGCDTVSLYRPGEQRFYIINRLGNGGNGLGRADASFVFGNPGDQPFAGDFDGNGIDDVGLHRESTGLVYYRLTPTSGPADVSFVFGNPGDRLVTGDWEGDGVDTVALYRPENGRWYLKLDTTSGIADHAVGYSDFFSMSPVAGWFATESP